MVLEMIERTEYYEDGQVKYPIGQIPETVL